MNAVIPSYQEDRSLNLKQSDPGSTAPSREPWILQKSQPGTKLSLLLPLRGMEVQMQN